jgi:hypothetical protein
MLDAQLDDDPAAWGILISWLFTHALGKAAGGTEPEAHSRSWVDEWLLGKLVAEVLRDSLRWYPSDSVLALDEGSARRAVGMVKILISHHRWFEAVDAQEPTAYRKLVAWLRDKEVQRFIQVNRYGGVLWFNKESFEQFLGWMLAVAVVEISAQRDTTDVQVAKEIVTCFQLLAGLEQAAAASEYQIAGLLEAVQSQDLPSAGWLDREPGEPPRPQAEEE